ncbi:MAG: acetate--CoA ligase family protein [Treponema sp.]|jgi:succinyl-CoA synthetase beta subunit|nr:acetate--CoA ligase family protein [Treponema sp.]
MKLLEYQAKTLLERVGIPTMKGVVVGESGGIADTIRKAGLSYPVVVKAQVQIGGRGKAGGVRIAENPEQAERLCGQMLGMDIRGLRANELMIVEKAKADREWYLSIMLDRFSKGPILIFSPLGGMDIEETARAHPEGIAKVPLDPFRGVEDYTIEYALDKTGADRRDKDALRETMNKLFELFYRYNTMLTEINPLGVNSGGALIALDAKVEIDDNALPSLPDILAFREKLQEDPQVIEARKVNFHFVPMAEEGAIGVMSNGSGMLMSCIDLIAQKGMKVHAALDLGGGATAERIFRAVAIMFSRERIGTVFICIFGGITRCDEVARGACAAMVQAGAQAGPGRAAKQLVLRMEGTNKEAATRIVAESGLPIAVAEGIPKSVELIHRLQQESREGGPAGTKGGAE